MKQIKNRSNSGNACCHAVQNLLLFPLLNINTRNKIRRIMIYLLCQMYVRFGLCN